MVWGADSQDPGLWRLAYMNEVMRLSALAWLASHLIRWVRLLRLILKISRIASAAPPVDLGGSKHAGPWAIRTGSLKPATQIFHTVTHVQTTIPTLHGGKLTPDSRRPTLRPHPPASRFSHQAAPFFDDSFKQLSPKTTTSAMSLATLKSARARQVWHPSRMRVMASP